MNLCYFIKKILLFLSVLVLPAPILWSQEFYWPTPDLSFSKGDLYPNFIMPTIIEKPYSGLFGLVRSNGRQFHEGIDIRATQFDSKGEALDAIFATMEGRVVYSSKIAGNSSYGRYLVLEHERTNPKVYSLYAHLKTIDPNIKVGQWIEGGTVLGRMGRSAGGYKIPKSRAHLHFEIGVRLTDSFHLFYNRMRYKTKNQHGVWNGMNLVGINALEYFMMRRKKWVGDLNDYFSTLPTAAVVRLKTGKVPDFVKRYPSFLKLPLKEDSVVGWEIEFTWFGLPKSWKSLTGKGTSSNRVSYVELIDFEKKQLAKALGRKVLHKNGNKIELGKQIKRSLEILFEVPIK